MDSQTRLAEIIARGGARQSAMAQQLLARLLAAPIDSPVLQEEIEALYDAYLHDPYLTREPPE